MDIKKKIRKHVPTSSSSSSEDDDSSSSSSSSSETHHKKHRNARKQRDSSSSSEEEVVRKSHKHQHKKSSARKHSHSAKIRAKLIQANTKKTPKSMSPTTRAAHKHHLKAKLREKKSKQLDEHDRHAVRRSRTPTRRDVKKDRTPEHRLNSPTTRIRVSVPNTRVQDRTSARVAKDSPSINRRHVRETIDERDRSDLMIRMPIDRQKEREKMRRIQEEEHYNKYAIKPNDRPIRPIPSSRLTPDKHHHDRSRSHSHGRVPIRDRLDKDYEYRRSVSRERDDYPIVRPGGIGQREPIERPFDYRSEEPRRGAGTQHEYGQPRIYEDRHHRMSNWEENRGGGEPEPRGNRMYEGNTRNWEPPSASHERKRIPDDPPYKERQWNDAPSHDKWSKDKEPQDWKRGNWKDQSAPHPSPPVNPTMPHPRRWPGQMGDSWNSRPSHPHSSSRESHPSPSGGGGGGGGGGPPFKPRGAGPSFFGFKRFPYKRFPNQYSKINFPSKRVIPSASSTSTSMMDNQSRQDDSDNGSKSMCEQQQQQHEMLIKHEANESGEITTETEEDKIAQPDTTFSGFSGNVDAQYQEECEGNLSEFSDVDDEILNREEIDENFASQLDHLESSASASRVQNRIAYVNNRIFSPFSSDYYCIYGLLPRHADDDVGKGELARAAENEQQKTEQDEISEEQAQDENEQKMISKIHANKELKKEMDLDFEEISDGELEQESGIKGIGDALGVDWASLVKETQLPIARSSDEFYDSTKSRWNAHRILWDIGISVEFAGEEFARNKLTEARDELRREKNEWRMRQRQLIKKEEVMNGDIKKEELEIKMEIKEEDEEPEEEKNAEIEVPSEDLEDFELDTDVLLHPLAHVQVLMRKLAIKRRNLILHSTGKYGRALSARKDLKLRRHLYNLPTQDLLIDRSCTKNSELNKDVEEIYRKLVGEVN